MAKKKSTPLIFLNFFLALTIAAAMLFFWLEVRPVELVQKPTTTPLSAVPEKISQAFPVGVDQDNKTITEDPLVDSYVTEYLSINISNKSERNFVARIFTKLKKARFYQQLASVVTKTLVIYPGQRKEEVVQNFTDILGWNEIEKARFATLITSEAPELPEGKFFPGYYHVPKVATPESVAELLIAEFRTEIINRYSTAVSQKVSLNDALTIASLLEREAYDFTDMRIISGIIWNRLFIDMPLQLDASLQYARGSLPTETKWWPQVIPDDKYLESPFNTYLETGLPPTPIANPSLEAVVAALNPKITDCLFYFHDADGVFYCTETYQEHVKLLKEIYGQGK